MAEKLHTHYANLKVTQNAPVEVIKAAYKAMAQKYHPDRHPGDGAQRVMQGLNESWNVLSDPVLRAEHDAWIAEQEAIRLPPRRRRSRKTVSVRRPGALASLSIFVAVSSVSVAVYSALSDDFRAPAVARPDAAERPLALVRVPQTPASAREHPKDDGRSGRALLEFGQALPKASGPIIGARQTKGAGRARVTIDNPHETAPVVAKLCHAVWSHCWPLQHVYIEPGGSFTLKNLSPGKYDVRHVNLDSGGIYRSGMFEVLEPEGAKGAYYTAERLQLQEPADGQSGATRIDLHQF
ncbi:J domain-containing protein [Hydrogenophaga sp.]|uniref:J domain-containing protein n=1 Tax=Hydrogenophaga sp. TaxID=1904254 RepID=UPI003F72360A